MPMRTHPRRPTAAAAAAALALTALGVLTAPSAHADDYYSDTDDVSYGNRTSSTWAGYSSIKTSSFRQVTASWRQPSTTCASGPNSKLAVWAGIDGDGGSGTVLQGGTTVDCQNGTPNYRAWFQYYQGAGIKSPPQYLDEPVSPGDIISVTVTVDSARLGTVNVTNFGRGGFTSDTWDRYYEVPAYSGQLTSAEAIIEAPSSTITDFGTVRLSAIEIDQQPASNASPDRLTVIRSGDPRITCSDLREDDFDCTWIAPN